MKMSNDLENYLMRDRVKTLSNIYSNYEEDYQGLLSSKWDVHDHLKTSSSWNYYSKRFSQVFTNLTKVIGQESFAGII
jgi:hypothetical protein